MEYKEPLISCDRILALFEGRSSVSNQHVYDNVLNNDAGKLYTTHAITKLIDDNRIFKSSESYYQLKGDTLHFIEDGGYEKLVERENKKGELKSIIEDLGLKSVQSVIDTNTSIQNLNTQTDKFYDKQKKYNTIQKFLTGTIVLATIAYTASSIKSCSILQQTQTQEESLKKIKSLIDNQTLSDSLFRKSVKDILETP